MAEEIMLNIVCESGTKLCFYVNELNGIDISKNNYMDVATLNKENINQLKIFLNSLPNV